MFLGLYDADPDALAAIIDGNIKENITGNATQDSTNDNTYIGRRRLLATYTYNGVNFTGNLDGILCANLNRKSVSLSICLSVI